MTSNRNSSNAINNYEEQRKDVTQLIAQWQL